MRSCPFDSRDGCPTTGTMPSTPLSYPRGNRTTDADINAKADADDRVVVTKDRDFRDSHLLRSTPRRLLIVATGNVSNNGLLALFDRHLDSIVAALEEVRFVELTDDRLIVHEDR